MNKNLFMKKTFIILILIISSFIDVVAQQIPLGSCGFVYIHDAAGNRTRRVYFCNNSTDPYPTKPGRDSSNFVTVNEQFTKDELQNMEFQPVDALYPNPTSGIFYITFSKSLSNANITLVDMNGKTVQRYKASGIKLTCDLSAVAAGIYFVKIEENGKIITKKVIKQ